METRNIFSKKKQKSSSKHETEWNHELPCRFLCRTSFEVIIESSEEQRDMKVIRNHESPVMSSNGVNQEQNGRENEADYENDKTTCTYKCDVDSKTASLLTVSTESSPDKLESSERSSNLSEPESSTEKQRMPKTFDGNKLPSLQSFRSGYVNGQEDEDDSKNGKAATRQRNEQDSKSVSLLSVSSESSTEKLKTSERSSNFSEPESSTEKEPNIFDGSQLQEHSPNFHSNFLNVEATMEKNGLFSNKFIDPKSGFCIKSNSNQFLSKNHSAKKYLKDFSPLRMCSNTLTDTHKNDLAGGDYAQIEIEEENRATITENNQLNKLSGNFLISDKDINKHRAEPASEESIYLEMDFKNDNYLRKSFNLNKEMLKDYNNIDLMELEHKKVFDKECNSSSSKSLVCQEPNIKHSWMSNSAIGDSRNASNESSEFNLKLASNQHEDESFKECFEFQKVPFKNCITINKSTNGKGSRRSEINSDGDFSYSSNPSSASFDINNEFATENKELPNDRLYAAHGTVSSDNDFHLSLRNKYFSHPNNSDTIPSVSSNVYRDGESYQSSMNDLTTNAICKSMDKAGISLAFPASDSNQDLKGIYIVNKPTVKSGQEEFDSSEGGGSVCFDMRAQDSSLDSNAGHESATTSNTHHSVEDFDKWKISVNELVQYFENLNSETDIRENKAKTEFLAQISITSNEGERTNENFQDFNRNKRKLHMGKGYLNNDKESNDLNTFNLKHRCFDISKNRSSDLLHDEETRKRNKCDSSEENYKSINDLMKSKEYVSHHVDKLKETASVHRIPKVDILHFSKSESNIPLLHSLKIEHQKESTGRQPADDNTHQEAILSGGEEKSSENQVGNSNGWSFFSRWRIMALIIVLVVLSIDWKNLLECRNCRK